MGIIALKSPLDTAVRILDYRLSKAKDTTTRSIYEYCISCLRHKIDKTYKKYVASVSSLSVFPNKYASLVVEDVGTQYTMDCADTTTSFVSPLVSAFPLLSTGVLKRGLAPDIKQGVLNSHVSIKNPLSPLASSDLESPTDELEGFPMEL